MAVGVKGGLVADICVDLGRITGLVVDVCCCS